MTNCLSVFDHFVGLALKGLTAVLFKFTKEILNGKLHFLGSAAYSRFNPYK